MITDDFYENPWILPLKTTTRLYIDGQVQDAAEGDVILYDKYEALHEHRTRVS